MNILKAAVAMIAAGLLALPAIAIAQEDNRPDLVIAVNGLYRSIEPIDGNRTRMSIASTFPSPEAMEQVLAMGMEEGLTEAVGQIDAILAEGAIA